MICGNCKSSRVIITKKKLGSVSQKIKCLDCHKTFNVPIVYDDFSKLNNKDYAMNVIANAYLEKSKKENEDNESGNIA